MAEKAKRSLASRASSVARRVVGRQAADEPAAKKAAPAKKATTKKAAPAAKKATPTKKSATKSAGKKSAAPAAAKKSQTPKTPTETSPAKKAARTTSTKKTATTEAPAVKKAAPAKKTSARKGTPGALVVLPGEKPWTKEELDEVKVHLRDDVKRLVPELDLADGQLHDLMVDSGDGAGADQADVGSSSFERDQEITIANNAREMLEQSQHALERIADGTYGVCESCGEPIGKMRLMAFPRATLCMTCKQREERR